MMVYYNLIKDNFLDSTVVIGKPELPVRKALHSDSKQQ